MESTLLDFEHAIKQEGIKNYVIKLLLLAVAYVLTAYLGLSLSSNDFDQITTIWPPTGISILALLLWGFHYWPGVFVGAFMANSISDAPSAIATCIAIGNTLEAIVAVYLIRRYLLNGNVLEKISSTLGFVALVPFLSTIVSASIGVGSLLLGDIINANQAGAAWLTWWVGNMMGALMIVPFVIAWRNKYYREVFVGHAYEATALLLLVVMANLVIFNQPTSTVEDTFPLIYLVFPLVMFAAVRFTQIGAVTAASIISTTALWGTLSNTGPFANQGSFENKLFSLHFFLLVVIITALVLSVAVYGRIKSERALAIQTMELEEAKQLVMQNVEWRKNLQEQMDAATDKINNILVSVLESNQPKKPRR